MAKSSDLTPKQAHDAERQSRAQLVRLDAEEQAGAEALVKKRKLESVPALLRGLLRSELGLPPRARR